MSGPRFQEICQGILSFIALTGPVHKTQIENSIKPKIDHPRIHKAVKQLLSEKLIRISRRQNMGMIKYYDLTPHGLRALILGIDRQGLKQSDVNSLYRHLAQKYCEYYPCVFKLWPDIVKAGVEDLAQRRCLLLTRTIQNDPEWSAIADQHYKVFPEEDAHYQIFLDPFHPEIDDAGRERWLKFVKGNEPLRHLTVIILNGMFGEQIDKVNRILGFLGSPPFESMKEDEYSDLLGKIEELEEGLNQYRQILDGKKGTS